MQWTKFRSHNAPVPYPTVHQSIYHKAPFCDRNVHISDTKWGIVGYFSYALWDLWEGSIAMKDVTYFLSMFLNITKDWNITSPLIGLNINKF